MAAAGPLGSPWCSLEQLPLSHHRRAALDPPGGTLGGGAQVGRCQDLDTAQNDAWRVAGRPGLPGYSLCSGEPQSRADPDGCFSVRLLFQMALAVVISSLGHRCFPVVHRRRGGLEPASRGTFETCQLPRFVAAIAPCSWETGVAKR